MKKRGVICIPSLRMGGAEKFVVQLAQRIDKNKFDIQVAVTRDSIRTPLWEELEKNNIQVVDLSDKFYFWMNVKQFRYFKRFRPDFVHANIGSILHIMLMTKLFKIKKRIYTVHNEAKLLHNNRAIKKWVYRIAFQYFSFIPVAISETVKKSLVTDMNIEREKIPIVRNGVDTQQFQFMKKNHDGIQIISVGSLYDIKNHKTIIKVFSELRKKYDDIYLCILGDGYERTRLENLVHELGLDDCIFMPGIKENVEVYLQASDIYVSASLTEGLPLSILEAMSTGLPIVATAAGGTIDIVKDEINGYLIPLERLEMLEQAIEKLIISRQIRDAFSHASRKIAEEWSLEQTISGYEKLY